MNKNLLSIIIFALISFSTQAQALNCKDTQNDSERSQCLVQEERTADTELNKAYKELMKYTSNKKELIASELTWIKWRDNEAKFQSLSYKGGTEESAEYSKWITKLTKERIQHLKLALRKIA